MASAHILYPKGGPWFERHDGLVDWLLILLGVLIAVLAHTSHHEAF